MNKKWIGVVSKAHVMRGVESSFAQVCHGKKNGISRLGTGDWFIYYSPKTHYPEGKKCQEFTALGQVTSGNAYQVDMGDGFKPYRIDVSYEEVTALPIANVKDILSFTNGKNWGMKLRFGLFQISDEDFCNIYLKMCGHHYE